MITRYHTKSGSTYEIRIDGEHTFARRIQLGAGHTKNPDHLARRKSDGLDEEVEVDGFECRGVGHYAVINLRRIEHPTLCTSPVTRVEEVAP